MTQATRFFQRTEVNIEGQISAEAFGASNGQHNPRSLVLAEVCEDLPPAQAYPAGVDLFLQGAEVREVYVVESGLVKLVYLEKSGHEVIAGLRSPNWMLGSAAAILGRPYAVTATTLSRCRLSRIPAEHFRDLLQRSAHFSWRLHEMQSQELYEQLGELAGLGCLCARKRLERLLLRLVIANGPLKAEEPIQLYFPLRQREVAQLIAVTPTYLSELMAQLERDGILRRTKGPLTILDPTKLTDWIPLNSTCTNPDFSQTESRD